jgi:hypothetical protein
MKKASRFGFSLLFMLLAASGAWAQARQSSRDNQVQEPVNSQDDLRRSQRKRKRQLLSADYFDKKVEEYHKRMKANLKKYKKIERLMKKPQYSDPSFFGHKKRPKKRRVGKKKFCKECGIFH